MTKLYRVVDGDHEGIQNLTLGDVAKYQAVGAELYLLCGNCGEVLDRKMLDGEFKDWCPECEFGART